MKLHPFSLPGLILTGGLLLAVAGCNVIPTAQPDTTRYYVLTSKMANPDASTPGGHTRVSLRPIEIPSFLRGKAMQVRQGDNEIHYAEDARWAESLDAGLSRVLRDGLEGRGGISHVVSSPGEEHDFEIAVRLLRCEGDREGKVARLYAVIDIYPPGAGSERRVSEAYTMEVPGWDGSYGQLALKLSVAASGLCDSIAQQVAAAEKK